MCEKYLYGSEGGAGHDRPYPYRDSLIEAGAPGAKREPDRAKPQLLASSAKILLRSDHPVCAFALLGASTLEASPYRARASRPPLRGGEYRAPYDGFSHETNQSMAARRESPLTECPVSFCTRNTNFSFAPILAYASEALFAASITPGRGVSESESPLITIKGRGAMSGSMAGPSNSE